MTITFQKLGDHETDPAKISTKGTGSLLNTIIEENYRNLEHSSTRYFKTSSRH